MTDEERKKLPGKTLALVILVAVVTAVAVTVIQNLLFDRANIAVTGGVVGAVTAALLISTRKRSRG